MHMIRGLGSLLCMVMVGTSVNGPGSDPSPLSAVNPLPFFYDLYTFRGDDGGTDVVAAFAVPVERLNRENQRRGVRYRFDVSLVLADTALRSVSRTDDSVYVAVDRPLSRGHLLHTYIQVAAPPSVTTLQRVIMTDATTPGVGQLYTTPFPIPDYTGSELMLSDIALGLPGSGFGWSRGDIVLALLPTSQFPDDSFDVYYEIYNLPDGSRYTTEISIESSAEAGADSHQEDEPVRTRFTGESNPERDGAVREIRHMDVSRGIGHHRLTVTVTNEETGETATRSRTFQVRGSGPGATLVAALPRGTRTAHRR